MHTCISCWTAHNTEPHLQLHSLHTSRHWTFKHKWLAESADRSACKYPLCRVWLHEARRTLVCMQSTSALFTPPWSPRCLLHTGDPIIVVVVTTSPLSPLSLWRARRHWRLSASALQVQTYWIWKQFLWSTCPLTYFGALQQVHCIGEITAHCLCVSQMHLKSSRSSHSL